MKVKIFIYFVKFSIQLYLPGLGIEFLGGLIPWHAKQSQPKFKINVECIQWKKKSPSGGK